MGERSNPSALLQARCRLVRGRLLYVAVALLLLLLASSSASLDVRAAAPPAEVVIGVIMPMTGEHAEQGLRAKTILEMYTEDLNSGVPIGGWPVDILAGASLRLDFKDSEDNVMTAQRRLHELHAEHGTALMAVIGEYSDDVTVSLDFLATTMGVMVASSAASTASLGSPLEHPSFVRTTASAALLAQFWIRLAQHVGWYRLATLAASDDRGIGMSDMMLREAVEYNLYASEVNANRSSTEIEALPLFDLHNIAIPVAASSLTTSVISQALDQLYTSDVRIFLLQAGPRNAEILRLAYHKGMVGMGPDGIIRQWGGDYCTQEFADSFDDLPGALFGSVCTSMLVPRTRPDLVQTEPAMAFESRLRARNPSLWPSDRYVSNFDIATASSLFALVGLMGKTFADPTLPNIGTSFFSKLTKRDGSDPFEFTEADHLPMRLGFHGDPIVEELDIFSYSSALHRFVVSGTFNVETMDFTPTNNEFIMATGSESYTKDRAHVYVTDDPLPQSLDGKIVVLSFVVVVLGAWTALILLEQALSFWSRGVWKQACGWVALASVAFGSCSVWPNSIMVLTSLTLDVDAEIAWEKWNVAVSAVYPLALTLASFLVAIWSVDGGLKPAANVNVDELSAVTGQSSTTGSASGSGKSSSHTPASRSRLRVLRTAVTKQLDKFRDFLVDTMRRAGAKLVLSSLLLTACFISHFLIVVSGFHMRAELHLDAPAMVGAAIFAWVLNFIGLGMYFHVTRSGMRYFAPFVLCVSLLVQLVIMLQSSQWTYVRETDVTTEGMEHAIRGDYTLAVIVAAVSAATCVALMAFNVNRLRVSRNALDKVLAQVGGQVRALENDIDYEKEVRTALIEQGDFFRRSLEVINLCRPLWRPYAVAIALADPDNAAAEAAAEKLGNTGPQALEKGRLAPAGTKKAKAAEAGGASSLHGSKGAEGSHKDSQKGSKSKGDKVTTAAPGAGAGVAVAKGAHAVENSAHGPHSSSGVEMSAPRPQLPGTMMTPEQPTRKVVIAASPSSAAGAGASSAAAAGGDAAASSTKTVTVVGSSSGAPSDFNRVHAPKREKQLLSLLKELHDLHLENPPPGRAVADVKLPVILSNPMTLELMKDVLAKNLSPENIALWIDIQRYRSLENAQVRKAVADEICQTFIVSGAKFEVNLSSFMRDYVMTQVGRGASGLDLFDEVEREIYRLMVTNNLEPLVQSSMFKLAALVVQHPALKLKSVSLVNNVRGEIGGNVPSAISGGAAGAAGGAGGPQQTGTGGGTGSQGIPQGSQGMRTTGGASYGVASGAAGGGGVSHAHAPAFTARLTSNSQVRGSGINTGAAGRAGGGAPAGLPASSHGGSNSSTPRQMSTVAAPPSGASHVELAWPTK